MFKRLSSLLITLLLFGACNVKFVPTKSIQAIHSVEKIQTDIDSLYNTIAKALDKSYVGYSGSYLFIESEIDSLISYDKGRSSVSNIVHQLVILRSAVFEYETEHKAAITISAGEAIAYKKYLDSYIHTILVSENSLK